MSNWTFKKRKNCLHLNFVNYKFINLPIFTPPYFANFHISPFALFRVQRYVFSVFYLCDLCDLRGFGK